ncbi:hypothetical protein COV04_00850 [Candidatus Uhrbacteria bacterium CG10_big_fil_rev_8_21_14_0_10_48_11]|uniref:Uncharacterized protein n=1 Tax=Candidatus Uhrbacteria bacterium CG10_big_fil_rev_8_21_14_0_10_48_11 TaxID=1975037 RepID=A0A2M8LFI4_9BACT|nr:MAG: hypothetical protein COV04_00850 [Candidatus Uhrbacteria bacterium CG10_big_fil_rev_8_21_14_0_10_48_11]
MRKVIKEKYGHWPKKRRRLKDLEEKQHLLFEQMAEGLVALYVADGQPESQREHMRQANEPPMPDCPTDDELRAPQLSEAVREHLSGCMRCTERRIWVFGIVRMPIPSGGDKED